MIQNARRTVWALIPRSGGIRVNYWVILLSLGNTLLLGNNSSLLCVLFFFMFRLETAPQEVATPRIN